MTKKEALNILALIETVYSSCLIKNQTVIHWLQICSELDYENVLDKIFVHMKVSPYPPTMEDLAIVGKIKDENLLDLRIQLPHENNRERIVPKWMQEYSIKDLFI
ncbi:hypothetical protein V7266_27965 [Neobacillus drentensis]|uniref:hypothetical protein n=1 Tax=Neobacillus drentensis TaxID=220684 RepID=UPI002FFE602E